MTLISLAISVAFLLTVVAIVAAAATLAAWSLARKDVSFVIEPVVSSRNVLRIDHVDSRKRTTSQVADFVELMGVAPQVGLEPTTFG